MTSSDLTLMYDTRNLRTTERYVIAPPVVGMFGTERVSMCDMSTRGARLRHAGPLPLGYRATLKLILEGEQPLELDAVVVWCEADGSGVTGFVSGIRIVSTAEVVSELLARLHNARRSSRIEELRVTDRYLVMPALKATFGGRPVYIEDLSTSGGRIETLEELPVGQRGELFFRLPGGEDDVVVVGRVVWSGLKSMTGQFTTFRSGLAVTGDDGILRLAIGRLSELGNTTLDTKSLRLKLKVMRARARALASSYSGAGVAGVAAEKYLLIEGVREELRLNPEEAFHWYRRARLSIADPQTRSITPPISNHPDALAVWEYLDRSIDPSIIGRAFDLPD